MRYLKQREEFIRNNKYSLVKEATDSGPMANDINWGDSLLGRLINSVIRKAGIGVNLFKMDSVIDKLKESFDSLVADAKIKGAELSKDVLKRIDMIKISALLGKLKDSVDKGDEKPEVIKVTKNTIEEVSILKVQPESEEDKKELLVKLNEFLESIGEVADQKATPETSSLLPKMIENFTSSYNILYSYDKIKKSSKPVLKEAPKVVSKEEPVKVETPKATLPSGKLESYSSVSINEQLSAIDPNLLKAIKPLYDYMKQYLTFPDDENRRKEEFYNLIGNEQNKSPILKIYDYIKRNSVNEGLTELLTKPENIGAKLIGLYNVTKTKEAGDFTGVDDNMKAEIAKFNSSMKAILSKEEVKNENFVTLYKYASFISINEADVEEVVSPEAPTEEKSKIDMGSDLKTNWMKIFQPDFMKRWIVTDTEKKALDEEVNKLTKDSTKIVIDGIDPIVEIVKIFNRAYKIHTSEIIPSGRSGGKISNKTRGEYEWVGEGTPPTENQAGAWRNKALFNKWENAVLDIIKDSKYQVLFNQDTVIKVGKADTRANVSGERKKQGGGKALLTFINSMLDGSKLYKNGAQSKFIQEYFDVEVPSEKLGYSGKGGNDTTVNGKVAAKAKEIKKYSFKETTEIDPKITGAIYSIKTDDKQYYLSILESDTDYVYVKYSETFLPFKNISKNLIKVEKGFLPNFIETDRDKDDVIYPLNYARIPNKKFPIKPGTEMEIKSLNLEEYRVDKTTSKPEAVKFSRISKIYGVMSKDDKLFVLPDDLKILLNKNKDAYKTKLKEPKK